MMIKVKILQNTKVCFDGMSTTILEKGDEFPASPRALKMLISMGAIIDPAMSEKDGKKNREKILKTRAEKAEIQKKSRIPKSKDGKKLEKDKADLKKEREAFEVEKEDFEGEREAFEGEKEAFEGEKEAFEEEEKKGKNTKG